MRTCGVEHKLTISTRFAPWGPLILGLVPGLFFLYSGSRVLTEHPLIGLSLSACGVYLLVCCWFVKRFYIEVDDDFLYVNGLFSKQTIALEDIEELAPVWNGRGAFRIIFKKETVFGKSVIVNPPLGDLFADFPHIKYFRDLSVVRELEANIRAKAK